MSLFVFSVSILNVPNAGVAPSCCSTPPPTYAEHEQHHTNSLNESSSSSSSVMQQQSGTTRGVRPSSQTALVSHHVSMKSYKEDTVR